jgi:outer membrane autotransporter protein
VWTAGSLDFGKLNVDGSYDNRFSTAGLTIGLDKRIADGVTAGLALGYGLDHATFGSDGSKQDATAYTAMLYGSWRVIPKTFLDVTGGYGALHFDEKRWSAGGNAMLSGTRDGRSAFGSVGLTRTEKWDAWKVSGYGRLDVVHVMLDDYRETGSNLWALAYDELTATTVSAVAGLKAGYEIRTEWGSLTPGARLEYRHAFEGGFTQSLGYADLGTMPYSITGTRRTRDAITGGLSLRAMTFGDLGLDLEYLLTSDTHTVSNQQVRASVRVAF